MGTLLSALHLSASIGNRPCVGPPAFGLSLACLRSLRFGEALTLALFWRLVRLLLYNNNRVLGLPKRFRFKLPDLPLRCRTTCARLSAVQFTAVTLPSAFFVQWQPGHIRRACTYAREGLDDPRSLWSAPGISLTSSRNGSESLECIAL